MKRIVGAEQLSDPTTAGDFLRRLDPESQEDLNRAARRRSTRGACRRQDERASEVVFEVDDCGRTRERVAVVEEALPVNESNDGWFRTEAALVVVHLGRVFSIVVGGVLAVAPLECLPEGAQAVPMDEVGALQLAAAELIEIFCQGGE